MVLAGLAGSCHMISATILALARLVYEFYGKCDIVNVCMSSLKCKRINVSAEIPLYKVHPILLGSNYWFSFLHVETVGLHTTYHFNEKRGRERVEGEDEWEREEGGREGKRKESVLLSEVFSYRGCR